VVGSSTRTQTDAEGYYQVGVAAGEVTLEVTAPGFSTYQHTVSVDPQESLLHDIELTPLAESSLTVTVTDEETDAPVAAAQVNLDGPSPAEAVTDETGT